MRYNAIMRYLETAPKYVKYLQNFCDKVNHKLDKWYPDYNIYIQDVSFDFDGTATIDILIDGDIEKEMTFPAEELMDIANMPRRRLYCSPIVQQIVNLAVQENNGDALCSKLTVPHAIFYYADRECEWVFPDIGKLPTVLDALSNKDLNLMLRFPSPISTLFVRGPLGLILKTEDTLEDGGSYRVEWGGCLRYR